VGEGGRVIERKHPLAKCEECPLRGGAGLFVPSDGPEKAELAIVGEAPGRQEIVHGKPFKGPSGQLLDRVMEYHELVRADTLLTNATLCRPVVGVTPPSAAITACRPRLEGELRARGVRTAVALGNSAAEALLGVSGVTKLRVGRGRPGRWLPDVRVITTVHPAACLRQSDLFPHLATDLGKVAVESSPWKPPAYRAYDTRSDALAALAALAEIDDFVVVDIECDVDKDLGFDHPNQYKMLCVGLCYADNRVVVIGEKALEDEDVQQALGEYLRSHRVAAHNGKFDLAGVYPLFGDVRLWFDTMLANYCLDERPGQHALGTLGVELLGAPDWKDDLKPYLKKGVTEDGLEGYMGYGRIPRPVLYKYNAYDCAVTRGLVHYYERELQRHKLRNLHDALVRRSNELKFVDLNGIALDIGYNNQLMTSYVKNIDYYRDSMNQALKENGFEEYVPFNPNSPKQTVALLEGGMKFVLPRLRNPKTGLPSPTTNKEAIAGLKEKVEEDSWLWQWFDDFQNFKREAKLYGTFVKGIRRRLYRGRVYPTFLLHGTTSGRLACRNPNLQNIPRASTIRRQFVPARSENVFISVDYSQAELRVLTYLAQEPWFRDIFNGGERDLFDELTPRLYPGATLEKVGKAGWKELRIRVKAFVYGLGYGRSEFSIAKEYKMPIEEAVRAKEAFFETIPNVVKFQEDVRAQVQMGRDLVTPFGRHRRFHLITNENWDAIKNEALAFLPQSTAADICMDAFVRVRRELRGVGWVRNLIHDAILVEAPANRADEVAVLMQQIMEEEGNRLTNGYVRFATEATIGRSWGDV
jgi:uracil-DNA glycosylase family 4